MQFITKNIRYFSKIVQNNPHFYSKLSSKTPLYKAFGLTDNPTLTQNFIYISLQRETFTHTRSHKRNKEKVELRHGKAPVPRSKK